jgi:hypothetical protein
MEPDKRNYSYETYSLVAPLYLGLINMCFGPKHKLAASLFSAMFVLVAVRLLNLYRFQSQRDWNRYALTIFAMHFLAFFIITNYIESTM